MDKKYKIDYNTKSFNYISIEEESMIPYYEKIINKIKENNLNIEQNSTSTKTENFKEEKKDFNSEEEDVITGGSNFFSDLFNDVTLGMKTDFNDLSCTDVINQVKGYQLNSLMGKLDMLLFEDIVLKKKSSDEIICETNITLSNTLRTLYSIKLYKINNQVLFKVTPI